MMSPRLITLSPSNRYHPPTPAHTRTHGFPVKRLALFRPYLGHLPQDLVVPITELHFGHMTCFRGHMTFFLLMIGLLV